MKIFLSFLLLLSLVGAEARAAAIDLYVGEVAVASQGASDRRRALPLALENVLQKVSGLRTFEDYPMAGLAMDNASSMLVSFHYRNAEKMLPDGSATEELRLVARFDPVRVDELARSLQLPFWQPSRAPLEIWVVLDDGLDRRIFPVEFSYAWNSMEEVADHRGLGIRWPQTDEEGLYAIDAQLLWGGYTEDLGNIADGGVMIAAARREGLEWGVRNNMSYGDEHWTWRIQDIDLQAALNESLQLAIDQVARSNSIAAADLGTWVHELEVSGLGDADKYRRCLGRLQALSVVRQVDVVSASEDRVRFSLQLSALPRYLEEALINGDAFEFDESSGRFRFLP